MPNMLLPEGLPVGQLVRARPAIRSVSDGLGARPWLASLVIFGVAYIGYLTVGALIVFGTGSIPMDTWARVGNAHYAMYSRDPHLGAIGFVWSPLPTLAIMPILPFKALWPALVTSAFAGPITTAAFMAGGVVLVRRILVDLAVAPWMIALLVALFALHPMIVYSGANGLSEAPFLFFILWATASLLRWLDRGRLADLVRLGLALAMGYLARYEYLAAAIAAILVVAVVGYLRAHGTKIERRTAAVADAVVVGLPFAMAFLGWALASWMLVGSPFAQFSSVYGNFSQAQILHEGIVERTGQGTSAAFGYLAAQVLGLAPLLPVIGSMALVRAAWRADQRVLAVIAIIGGPVAFSVIAFLSGSTIGSLRYQIAAIPLLVVLGGMLLARNRPVERLPMTESWSATRDRVVARFGGRLRIALPEVSARFPRGPALPIAPRAALGAIFGLLVAVGIGLSLATGLMTMRHPSFGPEEADALRLALGNDPPARGASYVLGTHAGAARVAAAVDALALTTGSVLVDVATGGPIVLQSAHPDWFVITPDRDFEQVLADPAQFGVRYLIAIGNDGLGALDALNRTYPMLYEDGAGFATLVGDFGEPGIPGWRLYRIDEGL